MPTPAEKRRIFRALHADGCFVLPNPWDVGSARWLQSLGFKALATTSSGVAWSAGRADGQLPLAAVLDHIRTISEASDLPVNADFIDGFAREPQGVAANVTACIATGCAGLSIEDSTGDPGAPLHDFALAVARVAAARTAVDAAGGDTLLIARSECFLTGHPEPLKEALRRLTAFAEAGADCLYAPGAATADDIATIVKAVAPKPVNVLARPNGLSVAALADLGVRRVSVGGALARSAWAGFQRAAKELAEGGTFAWLGEAASGGVLDAFFSEDSKRRAS